MKRHYRFFEKEREELNLLHDPRVAGERNLFVNRCRNARWARCFNNYHLG